MIRKYDLTLRSYSTPIQNTKQINTEIIKLGLGTKIYYLLLFYSPDKKAPLTYFCQYLNF